MKMLKIEIINDKTVSFTSCSGGSTLTKRQPRHAAIPTRSAERELMNAIASALSKTSDQFLVLQNGQKIKAAVETKKITVLYTIELYNLQIILIVMVFVVGSRAHLPAESPASRDLEKIKKTGVPVSSAHPTRAMSLVGSKLTPSHGRPSLIVALSNGHTSPGNQIGPRPLARLLPAARLGELPDAAAQG